MTIRETPITVSKPAASPPSSLFFRLARRTAPLTRVLAGRRFLPLWAVVRHRGRRSGIAYSVPVVVRPAVGGVLIPLPWGPATNWARNVVAAGECVVVWKGVERRMVHPQVVGQDAAAASFGGFQRMAVRRLGIDSFLRLRQG